MFDLYFYSMKYLDRKSSDKCYANTNMIIIDGCALKTLRTITCDKCSVNLYFYLQLYGNPLTTDGAITLLKTIESSTVTKIEELDIRVCYVFIF